jgi:tetratricopeptide (TPR) repeat protein
MHDPAVLAQIEELALLADGLRQSGRLDDAEEILRGLNEIAPGPVVTRGLGLVLAAKGDWAQAFRTLQMAPADGEVLNAMGVCRLQLGDPDSALALADQALAAGFADAFTNRGAALLRLDRLKEASDAFRQALVHDPQDRAALANLAAALQGLGRSVEALEAAAAALALDPLLAPAHAVRANALYALGRNAEAIASYDVALALDPDHPRLQVNRGYCRLELGDFERGWRDHEARSRVPGALGPGRPLPAPLWEGQDLRGKTILLHCEQGMGDSIQFIRYAALVADRGAIVVVEAFQALERLFATAPGVDQVITRKDPLPPIDLHCPLMSLPLALGLPEPWAPEGPYLSAPADAVERWRGALPAAPLRIGLCCSGNPTQANDARRSIPLAEFVQALPEGPAYLLLHKDVREADRPALAERSDIAFLGDQIADFADTAALIGQMDLVVSVDTGVSHLAGALAQPVWILARAPADWRYAQHPVRTAWYPTATVYRQDEPGDWPGVLARVKRDLTALAGARGALR